MDGKSGDRNEHGLDWPNRIILFLIFFALAYMVWQLQRSPDFWDPNQ